MSTIHVWLPPNYLRWGGPYIRCHLNVFLLIHCFLVGPGGRCYLGGSAEMGGGSKTLLQPLPFFASQNNNYTRALLPMKYTEQLTGLQIGLTNICIVLLQQVGWLERLNRDLIYSSICLTLELEVAYIRNLI